MIRSTRLLLAAVLTAVLVGSSVLALPASGQEPARDELWHRVESDGSVSVDLYFFWSSTCPHCREALPFIDRLDQEHAWVRLHSYQVDGNVDAGMRDTVRALVDATGENVTAVPAFFFCEDLVVGYDRAETTGAFVEDQLLACRDRVAAGLDPEATADEPLSLPVIGDVDARDVSLPVFTVVVASLDAFNPCAFFVLLFLLSLLVHARRRSRMALVGGVFVLFSGLVYFAFMAAWLNVFQWLGPLRIITAVAGVVAVGLALVNIKDFAFAGRGPSLSIPEGFRPGLFRRMRALVGAAGLPAVLVGTVTLALAANSYELLCTAGFPVVFTRVLTLNELSTGTYYGYLALYNLVYIVPLLAITAVFVWRRGGRKLQEREGRALKLLSGLMMLQLGVILVAAPSLLDNVAVAVLLLAIAGAGTALALAVERRRGGTKGRPDNKVRRGGTPQPT